MANGVSGLTGLSAVLLVEMAQSNEKGPALIQLLNMEGTTVMERAIKSKTALFNTALYTASGWSSHSGVLAVYRVMGGLLLALEILCRQCMAEIAAWETL